MHVCVGAYARDLTYRRHRRILDALFCPWGRSHLLNLKLVGFLLLFSFLLARLPIIFLSSSLSFQTPGLQACAAMHDFHMVLGSQTQAVMLAQ